MMRGISPGSFLALFVVAAASCSAPTEPDTLSISASVRSSGVGEMLHWELTVENLGSEWITLITPCSTPYPMPRIYDRDGILRWDGAVVSWACPLGPDLVHTIAPQQALTIGTGMFHGWFLGDSIPAGNYDVAVWVEFTDLLVGHPEVPVGSFSLGLPGSPVFKTARQAPDRNGG